MEKQIVEVELNQHFQQGKERVDWEEGEELIPKVEGIGCGIGVVSIHQEESHVDEQGKVQVLGKHSLLLSVHSEPLGKCNEKGNHTFLVE